MTKSTGQRKTRSDKGTKKTPRTTAPRAPVTPEPILLPSGISMLKLKRETVYSLSLADALPLIKHGETLCASDIREFYTGSHTLTRKDCLDMLEKGWTTDRPTLDLPLGDVAFTQAFSFDTQGCYPDVAEYLSGSPECMVDFVMAPSSPKFLHLVVCTTIAGMTPLSALYERGKYVLSVIDSLESQGIRVKLTVTDEVAEHPGHGLGKGKKDTIAITVKEYQDPLDEALITYVLGHPSFYRICQWALADALYDMHNIATCSAKKTDRERGYRYVTVAFPSSPDTLHISFGLKVTWGGLINQWIADHKAA